MRMHPWIVERRAAQLATAREAAESGDARTLARVAETIISEIEDALRLHRAGVR